MAGFLFWNLQGKDVRKSLGRIAQQHDLDVIFLAERPPIAVDILGALSAATGHVYREELNLGCDYIYAATRLDHPSFAVLRSAKRFAIYRVRIPKQPEVLIAAAHLPAKEPGANTQDNMRSVAFDFAKHIARVERKSKHTRTVVVGDLNMDPYETGIISSDGLHAVPARKLASKQSRKANGRQTGRPFFNPMWRHWGDAKESPPGSFFLKCSRTDCLFWHMIDQVLYRDAITALFDEDALQILSSDGTEDVCTASGIPRSKFPDHFPILFKLKL